MEHRKGQGEERWEALSAMGPSTSHLSFSVFYPIIATTRSPLEPKPEKSLEWSSTKDDRGQSSRYHAPGQGSTTLRRVPGVESSQGEDLANEYVAR